MYENEMQMAILFLNSHPEFKAEIEKAKQFTGHSDKWSSLYDSLEDANLETAVATGLTYLIEYNKI